LELKDEAYGPFREQLKREKDKNPAPGMYYKEEINKKEDCNGANFRSKTSKLKVFEEIKKVVPPPGHYIQDANTISKNLLYKKKNLEPAKVCFDTHAPRFEYNKEPNVYT
jgi:hypothetical protein